jgi:glycosyltransferase involved in cell wall biosynthesis
MQMQVLLISTNDLDGGAARAAYRLHQGLCAIDLPSQLLVRSRWSTESSVIAPKTAAAKLAAYLDGQILRLISPGPTTLFSPQWCPSGIVRQVNKLNPDLISLHWICNGYLPIEALSRFHKPLVWTLHDMWPFTGGCHYSRECERYTDTCGQCPQLHSQRQQDLSHWIWQRKAKQLQQINLTIVTPSHWLGECARASHLFKNLRIEVIPHGLDLSLYRPIEKKLARELLKLPLDKKLVLFGATSGAVGDPRKGLQLLQAALQRLSETGWSQQLELVIFGTSELGGNFKLSYNTHCLGHVRDDLTLALIYSAADIMIVPSTQEAFGQTASEAMACGTPVVAFRATGLLDIVKHQENGYLATPFEVGDLAQGISWILENQERHLNVSRQARAHAEKNFALDRQAQRYQSLFTEILNQSSPH